ncbi:MAG: TfoX/Sxy family protein [Brachybacterium sp.]|uniref:TfoX/Sxy family protein n=1 Tax=unclassified Brachybacterium TaxID=2623841 RepID=UPI003F930BA7
MATVAHPSQEALLNRIRSLLPPGRAVREVSMFGGRAVMLEDAMLVSVGGDGSLLVRVEPTRHTELLTQDGARQAVMGTQRSMGEGWIDVEPRALAEDMALGRWLQDALEFHDR